MNGVPTAQAGEEVRRLAAARVVKLTRLVLPPGHTPVQDVMASIWLDGLTAGLQLSGRQGRVEALPEEVCADLENAELCSEYQEFPELDDRDFENFAYERVHKLSRTIHPVGHPEVSGDTVEIWMDGVGAALRIVKKAALTQ